MKQMISIIVTVFLVLSLSACGTADGNFQEPVSFYYCTDPESYQSGSNVFSVEVRDAGGYSDHRSLINLYLNGPLSDQLITPFPVGVAAEELIREDTAVKIRLSSQFARLTGSDLTIACAALSMTLFDLTDAQSVQISVADRTLDGREYVAFTREDFIFIDSSIDQSSAE